MTTYAELHAVLASMADNLQEHLNTIETEHPLDKEGFVVIVDPDLAQAIRVISETISQLSRICHRISGLKD